MTSIMTSEQKDVYKVAEESYRCSCHSNALSSTQAWWCSVRRLLGYKTYRLCSQTVDYYMSCCMVDLHCYWWLADITPLGQNPLSVARPDETPGPCRIRTQCTMSFSVTGKGVLKAKFQDWFWTRARGLWHVRGDYVRSVLLMLILILLTWRCFSHSTLRNISLGVRKNNFPYCFIFSLERAERSVFLLLYANVWMVVYVNTLKSTSLAWR